jgi:hypothetical protein
MQNVNLKMKEKKEKRWIGKGRKERKEEKNWKQ